MAVKTINEKKSVTKKSNFDAAEKVSKTASKKKLVDEDEDADASDIDNDLEEEVDDDWGKTEDDDSWDPDFEEFDLPKKAAKKPGKGKKGVDEDDDFGLEDDLSLDDDLFDDKDEFDDDF
jgi:DNA-directed RNA polymerase subunit delta